MKKIIALLLTLAMVLGFAACSEAGNEPTPEVKEPVTVGEKLQAAFKADSTGTAQEIADRLLQNEVIQFMGAAMPVEEGFLTGFDNVEIKGFKEGVMFAPMIGSIPFVGYIFVLEDEAKVNDFMATLKDNANLRWNICVEAEELIVDNAKNVVFFIMCPKSFDTPDNEEGGIGNMDMPLEGDVPAYDGETVGDVPAYDGEAPAEDNAPAAEGDAALVG